MTGLVPGSPLVSPAPHRLSPRSPPPCQFPPSWPYTRARRPGPAHTPTNRPLPPAPPARPCPALSGPHCPTRTPTAQPKPSRPTLAAHLLQVYALVAWTTVHGLRCQLPPRPARQLGCCAHHPTEPSSEMPISFCVSAMNSIGKCCNTSRTKPLTMSATASSSLSPRCMQ